MPFLSPNQLCQSTQGNILKISVLLISALVKKTLFYGQYRSSVRECCAGPFSPDALPVTQPTVSSEWVGLTSPSTYCRSFRRRVFPVSHLHWYWQPNKNNQETEHTNNRAWFSRLLRHPARKRSRSILTTPEPARNYRYGQGPLTTSKDIETDVCATSKQLASQKSGKRQALTHVCVW